MVLPQEEKVIDDPVSSVVKSTILSAFTFLTALSIRDFLTKAVESSVPDKTQQQLAFTFFITVLVLFITVLLAVLWNEEP